MRMGLPAEGFLRHRGLILVAAGGAAAEAGLLTLVAPAARPIAPQATALPALAAYHDLRWLFADSQSWLGFAAILTAALLARSAVDTRCCGWPGRGSCGRRGWAARSSPAWRSLRSPGCCCRPW